MKNLCSDIINQLVQSINNDSVMTVETHLVGSGARNLITQNARNPVDLDYNICVLRVFDININDGRAIKEHIKKHFNIILAKNKWSDCQDSTSALSTEFRHFTKGNQTEFKIDLAITRQRGDQWMRLIHMKTGFVQCDQWYWNEIPNSKDILKKVEQIKAANHWLEVRDVYLEKKNMYLHRGDTETHPSFKVYIETINEIHNAYFSKGVSPWSNLINQVSYSNQNILR